MQAAELLLVIGAAMLMLLIHRAGVPHTLRTIGSVFWAAASAWERMRENFRECMADARKYAPRQPVLSSGRSGRADLLCR